MKQARRAVRFVYSECFELYTMMKMLSDLPKYRQVAKQMNIDTDTDILHRAEQYFTSLSSHLKRENSYFFQSFDSEDSQVNMNPFALDAGFLLSIIGRPDAESAQEWLTMLENTPAEAIIRNMVPGLFMEQLGQILQNDSWESLSADGEKLRNRVIGCTLQGDQESKRQQLIECMDNPEETKARYMLLIRSFYSKVFQPLAGQLQEEAAAAAARFRSAFEQDPDFLKRVFKADAAVLKRPVVFHVSAVQQVGSAIFEAGEEHDVDWALIGMHNDRYFGPAADLDMMERLFKALADKRRLEILRLLRERPRFGKELADELGITPGAVTYHTSFLLALDIIQIIPSHSGDKRLYYSICDEQICLLLDSAKEALTNR